MATICYLKNRGYKECIAEGGGCRTYEGEEEDRNMHKKGPLIM